MEIIVGITLALAALLGQHGGDAAPVEHPGAKTMYIQRSACDNVDWTARDADGRPFVPFDANGDGFIDCTSDVELGA